MSFTKKYVFLSRIQGEMYTIFKLPLENVFNTNYSKNILISYITAPFKSKDNFKHSNFQEVREIARIFSDFGFNVDILHYLYDRKIDYTKYDVIFGFGNPFENSFHANCDCIRIYYATGAHVCFQNHAELSRIKKLQDRKGKLLSPRRVVQNTWSASTELCDAIISLGNEWTVSTYEQFFSGPIFNIPVTSYNFYPSHKLNRDWNEAKYNFLWIGSGGLVHKGLDVCLDAFKMIPSVNFHICGPKEDDFFKLYNEELTETPNICYHGFIDISSGKFKKIVEKCGFIIFPSCSEGGGASCITGMYTGLIPVVTKESSINTGNFGFLIADLSIEYLRQLIVGISQLEKKELVNRSNMVSQYCSEVHNIEHFRSQFKSIIRQLIVKSE